MSVPISQTSAFPRPFAPVERSERPDPDGERQPAAASARPPSVRRLQRLRGSSVVVGIVGLAVTATLVWLSAVASTHTQKRLLTLQVRQAGIILGEIVPSISTPLDTSVAVADATRGNVTKIESYVGPDVGTHKGQLFRSLSVWRLGAGSATPLLVLGQSPLLSASPTRLERFLAGIHNPRTLAVANLLSSPTPRLGFAMVSIGTSPRYAVYGELALPVHHRATAPKTAAFSNLEFALYLGDRPSSRTLIEATTHLPLTGPTASTEIPFGNARLDFVAAATASLSGPLLPALPWIIGAAGVLLTAAGALLVDGILRRRQLAEGLAAENLRLYAEQRSIAQSLQTALLPQELPILDGVEVAVRYVPGDTRADIGGDWYDVIRCDDHSFIFVVGDVSGHGVAAATTMASLHYAIRAYAAQGDDGPTILHKLDKLLDVARDGQFATVLLGHVDLGARQVRLVNAGHLPPLIVDGHECRYAETRPGTPIGVSHQLDYDVATFEVPPRASLLAFTDGLVERRGELLDVGLERLRQAASANGTTNGTTNGLVDRALATLDSGRQADDIAVLELRWTS